jgi:glutamate/aspartate transport system substrate-binding protein
VPREAEAVGAAAHLRAFALARARRGDKFRLLVDRTLAGIYRSGMIDQLFTNAFGQNADPTPALQALYRIHALAE